ncbi:hypothetical protein [Namhaeicola litoreus]|uniref:Uncharacterized protein n=1 Tax=Namhaeicola litoreus TaxID=1052145 RepID=A0ABW3XYQ5_9FLAO
MDKKRVAIFVLFACVILIILNVIFTRDEMGVGFWLRIVSGILLIIAMFFSLKGESIR